MSWSIRRRLGGTPVSTTAPAEATNRHEHLLPTTRLEAFSDGVFAIAITLLVIELHVPGGSEPLLKGLEHEWPRYLGYFVSFAFIGGVWIAHSNMTRFLKASDPELMRLNLLLLLFVSFLPFTTAIAATHLFASNLSLHEVTISSPTERVAAVLFGLNLTLAALMLYLMLRHAGRTSDVAADDLAEEELQSFATQRRSAVLLQASATVVGAFLPLLAVVFYLALAIFYVVDPVRLMHTGSLRRARLEEKSAENLRALRLFTARRLAGRPITDQWDRAWGQARSGAQLEAAGRLAGNYGERRQDGGLAANPGRDGPAPAWPAILVSLFALESGANRTAGGPEVIPRCGKGPKVIPRCGTAARLKIVGRLDRQAPRCGTGAYRTVGRQRRCHRCIRPGRRALGSISVMAEDTRIVLRTGGMNEPIVDHPRQPADYIRPFPDGPVWSWYQEWRVVGGVRLRVYEVVVSIVLRRFHDGGFDDLMVDHPGQPADYTHTDGTVWTWKQRWRLAGVIQDGVGQDEKERAFGRVRRHLRVYDLVAPGTSQSRDGVQGQPKAYPPWAGGTGLHH